MTNRREFLAGLAAAAAGCAIEGSTLANAATPAPDEDTAVLSAAALAADPRRPQYHLLPVHNWMNDPNGPIFWKGRYHMFCQYNPHAAVWGDMHWAHAVSPDMVRWQHLPIALAPTPGGPDADGCFTGSALDDHGVATILYTGVQTAKQATLQDGTHKYRETQMLATSSDPELRTWKKLPAPVIAAPPPGLEVTGFRDPCPWRGEDGNWYLGVGSGIRGQGGMVLLYRSKNLRQWEYLHPLATGKKGNNDAKDPVGTGEMWECPDFFKLGDRYVLIYSTEGKVFWQTGELDNLRFQAQQTGLLDHGAYYAPKTQIDAHGNRILWGWIPERRPEAEHRAAGWAGVMSLPRVLTLDENKRLHMEVLPAVESLRGRETPSGSTANGGMSFSGAAAEIRCRLKPAATAVTLSLSSGNHKWLSIQYDGARVLFDGGEAPLEAQRGAEIRCFVDGSVAEVFVNGQVTFTKRFYFEGSTAPEINVRLESGQEQVERLQVWQMKAISTNRLTT